MSTKIRRKTHWQQLDLFAELDDQTEGIENGEQPVHPDSEQLSQEQPTSVQGIDSIQEIGDSGTDSGGNQLAGEAVDPITSGPGDERNNDATRAGGVDQHGEIEGRGNSLPREPLQPALESETLEDRPENADDPLEDGAEEDEAPRFHLPATRTLVPSGAKTRAEANIEAIKVLRRIEHTPSRSYATSVEQEVLARYSGWGACQDIFDETNESFTSLRNELKSLLADVEYAAARHSTLNAHYTDPAIADAMLTALENLGLPSDATILEPGCGTGNFIGLREGYGFVGVELDPTSASVAKTLYPDADILAKDFSEKKGGGFDATVGNVPFGDYKVADSEFNTSGHNIHNYFIIKSLRLTKPGGLAAFVTSSYTLNSSNPAARIEMARYGEFLGAVRLPNSAHSRVAGTTVLTDIILFRRSEEVASATEAAAQEWIQTQPIGEEVRTNSHYVNHPEMILGQVSIVKGRFGLTLEVESDPDKPLAELLSERLGEIVSASLAQGQGFAATTGGLEAETSASANRRVGSIYLDDDGNFIHIHSHGRIEPFTVKGSAAASELRQLLKIRNTYDELLREEAKVHGDPEPARTVLNEVYDAYVAKFGPINRFTLSSRKQVDDDGMERTVKVYPQLGGFRKDKMFRAIAALEYFDDETGVASKAAIFAQPVVSSDLGILGTDDPAEAVAISLSRNGRVDLSSVSQLLGMSESESWEKIEDLVYVDPISGSLIDSAGYLSGNVRVKLAQARGALEQGNEAQARNVAALESVLPKDLDISEIKLRLGATYISPETVETAFNAITSTHNWDKSTVIYVKEVGEWKVTPPARYQRGTAITHEYGVPDHMDGAKILECLLNNREIQVRVMIGDNKMVVDPDLTAQARDKAEMLQEKMIETIVSNPELAEQVTREYNDRFNSIVPRTYSGEHLQLTSLARSFVPHPHQRQMVARILHSPTALAAHPVGAGKTAEMVIAGQILRRTGKISKPLYAVPNHMLDQFSREYLQLYPSAKILVADKDEVTPAARAEFVSRCASEVWDAVVMSHSSFGRIPLSVENERNFLMQRHADLEIALSRYQGSREATVKSIEKKITREIAKLQSKIDGIDRDDSYTFEQMGVDYLFVDEAHLYKNLATLSSSSELAITGSQRATDLEMKLHYLRETKNGEFAPRIATFATATPVANSPTEAYVMMRYLGTELLRNAGINHFDDFASTFTEKVSTMELSPAGTEYRMKERIAKYRNLPELHAILGEFMDYISPEKIKIPVPDVKGDGFTTINIPGDESLRRYTLQLGERAKAVRSRLVQPDQDNFLKITSDGRKAALDLRLVGRRYAEPSNAKAKTAAKEIYARHVANSENTYIGQDGTAHPRTGSLQLVFCDQSTPSDENWNVYHALRAELVRLGMPERSVRFIHEAKTEDDRHRLFEAAKSGAINVLIGSTGKMGTGVNVQDRAIAVHHLDAPWRPDELTQRIGRVVRQGNQNKEVDVVVYVNEGSFDVYSWQTLARKKNFIDQVLTSNTREVEDDSQDAISYAQVKALATGNPLHIRKAELDSEILKLERRMRAFKANQARGKNGIAVAAAEIERIESRIEVQRQIAEQWSRIGLKPLPKPQPTRTRWDGGLLDYETAAVEDAQAETVHTLTVYQGWDIESLAEVAKVTGTTKEMNDALVGFIGNAQNQYSSQPIRLDIDGAKVDIRREYEARTSSSYWSTFLTIAESEPGENPTSGQVKIEAHSVRQGSARIIQAIFREAGDIPRRIGLNNIELEKLHDKMAYYKSVATDEEFPEMETLDKLHKERTSIESILEATTSEEDELIEEILSEDDPYLIDFEREDQYDGEGYDNEEEGRLVASVELEDAFTFPRGRGLG